MDALTNLSPSRLPFDAAAPSAAASRRWAWPASAALLAVGWLLVFNQQRLEWSVNATYAYGWAVPLLAAYLFWERWRTRPPDRTPSGAGWLLLPALLLFAYLPVRIVQEANPDWVKINWIMAGLMAGLSLFAVFALAGARVALYCAFPVLFCFTALPWPVWMEDTLTKSLMHWNAGACAELLTLLGHPALAKGSTIQVGSTWVNVEEACSGIRSLQTAFMASLFFGEFHRLRWGRRVLLLLSSFAVAFVLNFARTVALTWMGGVGGHDLMEKWHDTAGTVEMAAGLLALWLLAELFRKGAVRTAAVPRSRPRAPLRAPFPAWFALAGVLWLAGSEGANAAWYAAHERLVPPPRAWTVTWPADEPDFHRDTFPDRTRALLKYNEGELASWRDGDGFRWQMYYLRWLPGRVSKFLAGSHYPTVCLPATGLQLVSETGPYICHVGTLALPFVTYLFNESGRDVYVFHAIVEDNPAGYDDRIVYRQASSSERLRSVLRGERNLGQRVVGVALTGPLDEDEARAALRNILDRIITTAGPAPDPLPGRP